MIWVSIAIRMIVFQIASHQEPDCFFPKVYRSDPNALCTLFTVRDCLTFWLVFACWLRDMATLDATRRFVCRPMCVAHGMIFALALCVLCLRYYEFDAGFFIVILLLCQSGFRRIGVVPFWLERVFAITSVLCGFAVIRIHAAVLHTLLAP